MTRERRGAGLAQVVVGFVGGVITSIRQVDAS
jgi:hypothetical protein